MASDPITINGDANSVKIEHNGSSQTIIQSGPFVSLVVKDDAGNVLFTAPALAGTPNKMWHVEIK